MSGAGSWRSGWLFNVMHTLASMKSADDFFNEPPWTSVSHYWKEPHAPDDFGVGSLYRFCQAFISLVPDNVIVEMILLAMIVGVTFSSVPLYAIWLPALWIFVPATLLPTILKLVLIYQPSLFIALFWTLILFLIIFYFGVRLNKIYLQGIYRSFEREFLMEQLIFQRQKADYIREAPKWRSLQEHDSLQRPTTIFVNRSRLWAFLSLFFRGRPINRLSL